MAKKATINQSKTTPPKQLTPKSTLKDGNTKLFAIFLSLFLVAAGITYGAYLGYQRYQAYVILQNKQADLATLTQVVKTSDLGSIKYEEAPLKETLDPQTIATTIHNYGTYEHLKSFYFGEYLAQIKSDRFTVQSINPEVTNTPQLFLQNTKTGHVEIWDLQDNRLIASMEGVEAYTDIPARNEDLLVQPLEKLNNLFYAHDFNKDGVMDFQVIKDEAIKKKPTSFVPDFYFYVSVDGAHKQVTLPEGLVINYETGTFVQFTTEDNALFKGELALKQYYLDKDKVVLFKVFYLTPNGWIQGAKQNFGKGMVTALEGPRFTPNFFPMITLLYSPGEPLKVYGTGTTLDLYSYHISDDNLIGSIARSPDETAIYYLDKLTDDRMMLMRADTVRTAGGSSIRQLDADLTDRNLKPNHTYRMGFISTTELLIVNDTTGEKHVFVPALNEWKDNPQIDESTQHFFDLMTAKKYSDPGYYDDAAKVKDTNTKKAIMLSPEEFERRFGKR